MAIFAEQLKVVQDMSEIQRENSDNCGNETTTTDTQLIGQFNHASLSGDDPRREDHGSVTESYEDLSQW
ncbi:MAG: hypothetical protein ACOC04_01060 [Halothece sp.]